MDKRPNFLMIVCDQERYDILGANGSQVCRTPNLDRLAAAGMRFTGCFTPTAICSPARASLLTGVYPHRHGMLNNCHGDDAVLTELPAALTTFSEVLAKAGYRLGYVGKWHVGLHQGPESRGFQDVVSPPYDLSTAEGEPPALQPIYARFPNDRMTLAGIDPRPIAETETHRYADAAIELLERYAEQTQPFFLRLDFEGPHHPYLPPQPFASWYDPGQIRPWPNFSDPLEHKPMAQRRLLEQRGVAHLTWQDWQVLIARYFGYMSFIDEEIGRVLRRLEELDLNKDTVILHLSDHGDMTGAHGGQFNKGPLMYDELYHIPLIICAPGDTQPNSQCDALVRSFDLMPTILELAQLAPPAPIDGQSLLPLLRKERDAALLDSIFAEYSGEEWGFFSERMLRTHTWKYVYNPHAIDECYNLREDPYELHNLIDEPAYVEVIQQLRHRLREWMVETQDPLARWTSRLF